MKKNSVKIWAIYLLAAGSLMACGTQDIQTGNLNVIPLPQEIVETPSAAPFVINSSTTICYEEGNEKLAGTARMLAGYIKEVTGTEVKIGTKAGKNCIILKVDPSITHKEGYELNVSVDVITLTGATEAGVFYGCQTIHKALPITDGKALASLPAGTVKDFPQYNYRGFMIDVGRHFFPKEYLKELIDVMALHNINYFHWHLTEDQGWRIEIKKYPKLTEVGSYRKETITAPGSGKFDGTPVSGYYTQEDAKEIVAYAAERFITVIPEIDMPGHMLAALASYPELGCTGGPYETATKFGVFKEVLCGGNPQTLQFAKDVVNELMDIFPDAPYIHIGGDECPKAEWMKCPKCQAKIKELGLHDTEEHSKENQLQVYFMNEVEKEIAKRGKKMLAWDEILEGNPNPETTTVMAWTGIKASVKAAQLGHSTIVCPISHLYFSNPGYNRLKGISSVERVYMFEPQSEKLTPEEKKNIIGVQGCIWTEWTKDSVKMEWQMMPRIAALSELQWCNPERKDLNGFLKRLRHQMDLYELYGYHYKEDIEDVTISVKPKGQDGIAVVELNTFDNASVYYTLDGSEPTSESLRYTEPFMINRTTTIKARAIRNGRESNVTEETLTYNLATMHSITCKKLLMTKKKLPVRFTGQHFTIDKVLIKDAIRQANISNQDTVLDIGAGKGFLTVHLLKIANNVVAIENDTALVEHLRKLFSDARNVQVVGCDFRNFAVPKFPFKVVSNIPYGITSDIFKILMFESLGNFLGGSIVLQLEPTKKLFSRKLYNPYTVFYHTFFDLKLVYEVGPESFLPPPTVKSALLNIKRKHLFFDFKFKAKYLAFISCLLEKPDLSVKTALKSIFRKSQVRSISEKFGLNLNAQIVCLSPSQWVNCFLEMLEVVPEKFHPS